MVEWEQSKVIDSSKGLSLKLLKDYQIQQKAPEEGQRVQ